MSRYSWQSSVGSLQLAVISWSMVVMSGLKSILVQMVGFFKENTNIISPMCGFQENNKNDI
ncbi:MAG: hypothetical protein ACOH2D_15470 [Gelidibacter sp.]